MPMSDTEVADFAHKTVIEFLNETSQLDLSNSEIAQLNELIAQVILRFNIKIAFGVSDELLSQFDVEFNEFMSKSIRHIRTVAGIPQAPEK